MDTKIYKYIKKKKAIVNIKSYNIKKYLIKKDQLNFKIIFLIFCIEKLIIIKKWSLSLKKKKKIINNLITLIYFFFKSLFITKFKYFIKKKK